MGPQKPLSMKVICVEDDPGVRDFLRRILTNEGYEVVAMDNAKDALALMGQSADFDAVVSDYHMPGMDGISFLEVVHARWPGVGRLILSGKSDAQVFIPAIQRGVIDKYTAKPVRPENFREDLSICLMKAGLRNGKGLNII